MNIALWVTQILLALIYGSAAFRKLFLLEKVRADQEWARQSSDGYIRFVAVSQLLGVAGIPHSHRYLPMADPVGGDWFLHHPNPRGTTAHPLEGIQYPAHEFIFIRTLFVYCCW